LRRKLVEIKIINKKAPVSILWGNDILISNIDDLEKVKLEYDEFGNIYALLAGLDSTEQVFIYNSSDDGETWSIQPVTGQLILMIMILFTQMTCYSMCGSLMERCYGAELGQLQMILSYIKRCFSTPVIQFIPYPL